jgi:Fur family transcriptional regulator, ferric uptake regulator
MAHPHKPAKRNTRQKDAVRAAFESQKRPLSTSELHKIVKKSVPAAGIATIYRLVKELLTEEWLTTVELPGEPARYELAGQDHHHHFHCKKCDRVFEVEGCIGGMQTLVPQGFIVESHEVTFYGCCSSCAKRG